MLRWATFEIRNCIFSIYSIKEPLLGLLRIEFFNSLQSHLYWLVTTDYLATVNFSLNIMFHFEIHHITGCACWFIFIWMSQPQIIHQFHTIWRMWVENDHIAGALIIEMNKIFKGVWGYSDGVTQCVISVALHDASAHPLHAYCLSFIHHQLSFHYLLSTTDGYRST